VSHWKPIDGLTGLFSSPSRRLANRTNLEPANADSIREQIADDVAAIVCEITRLPQVLRGGTLGGIVDIVSMAALTRRAKEEYFGAPCVEIDCTVCDQF
jgi:hypothetical protein